MNTRRHALLTLLAGTAVLTGCASPQVTDYAQERPLLELDRYFTGRVLAHGVFQKRGGEVARRFTVVMDCHWEGNQGVLDEAFTYSDGSTERRIWRLTKHADGRYTGRADDVDVAMTHDCFTISELIEMEDLGFCKKGESASGRATLRPAA